MSNSTSLFHNYLLHVDGLIPEEFLGGRGAVEVFDLAESFQEIIEELFPNLDVFCVFIALYELCGTAIFFSGMGGMYNAGHSLTNDSLR